MGSESETRQVIGILDSILGDTYETEIKDDGGRKVSGRGQTPEVSQREASKKWRDGEDESSGCYLTTACVNSMGLQDDCLELNVLRSFRDKILMQSEVGKRSVKDYYRIAPEMVLSINQQDNSYELWEGIYGEIRNAVKLVLSGDFEGAFEHYRTMTSNIEDSL